MTYTEKKYITTEDNNIIQVRSKNITVEPPPLWPSG